MQKTLGGDRLGSGKKIKVDLHGYERSTHNMGYIWRSTIAAGTLVPYLNEVALPGDTFDINLDCDIKTHPTIGRLFGSYKVQLDVFQAPIRLYQGQLHNNKLGIGMNMTAVKLPLISLIAKPTPETGDIDNIQINPSSILSYLGIRGIGANYEATDKERTFNGIPLLAYWDIYKNYYANKQEEIGAVIHIEKTTIINTVDAIDINGDTLSEAPASDAINLDVFPRNFTVTFTGADPDPTQIIITLRNSGGQTQQITLEDFASNLTIGAGTITGTYKGSWSNYDAMSWGYANDNTEVSSKPTISTFPLSDIDEMREAILAAATSATAFDINAANKYPFKYLLDLMTDDDLTAYNSTQEGLGIKTYQSDLFNNWLSTEWIDGAGGISEVTAIDTSGGSFTIDTLNLSRKVYNMLNRIAVSGGTYDDWLDAVYTHDRYTRCESPIYHGGLIKELVFQEVVSNSQSTGDDGSQPLGTLAGKGTMAKKHKGGSVTIKIDEPSYIIGIISLTPRIDYSQGNKWDINLKTMDDLHKPTSCHFFCD